ncbi:MAG TPA: LptF/LptG family permease [Candidatus Acidoferrales bacterium]|jgi:lipopolysaccharide export system permease protein|nr:LptF/LptG family permease [Candidatus Acidoferrales bacterium]
MRLHDRYLFRELLTPLAICLGGFLPLCVSFFFFTKLGDMREAKLVGVESLEYCLTCLPEVFIMVMPWLLLLAMLYALSNHARYNEITALRAAGISLWRICAPYFIVGLIATGAYFLLNEVAVPQCQRWSLEILNRHVKNHDPRIKTRFAKVPFRNDPEGRMWYIGLYDTATTTMYNVNVEWALADGSRRQLVADQAVHADGVWVFTNVQLFAMHGTLPVPLHLTNNVLAMPEFKETPRQFKLEARFSDANGLVASRSADIPLSDLWPYLRQNAGRKDMGRLLTKFHVRIASPLTCLIVVLMAIPFGAQTGRRNLFFGVAGSIFICFVFFVLQQFSQAFGMSGHLPGWLAAWLPNFIFAGVGFFLTWRVR